MRLCGIDPGLHGALAALAPNGTRETLCETPTLVLRITRGSRAEEDVPGLAALLPSYTGSQAHVVLEERPAMPEQGTRSMVTVGLGMGGW
jgi:hypothetical protein